jgi:hypothetical protein
VLKSRERRGTFFGHVTRRDGMENIIATVKISGKKPYTNRQKATENNCCTLPGIMNPYTVAGRNIAFLVSLSHVLLVEFWETSCKSNSLPADRNKQRGNQRIIVYFYYLIQNINVNGVMLFFCRIKTILMQCLRI